MEIKIANWCQSSLIDYPEKLSAVLFLAGCNLRCHYCHNRQIWDSRQNRMPLPTVLTELQRRVKWLDAVVVSGGEPTVFPNLIPLLQALRPLGLLIKLDTNGTHPEIVRKVVEMGLVDFIALDIKAPPEKHVAITGVPIDPILQTAQFLKAQNRVKYLLRTTVSPQLTKNDMKNIGQYIVNGAIEWQIQQCRIEGAYSVDEIQKMVVFLKQYALYVVARGV